MLRTLRFLIVLVLSTIGFQLTAQQDAQFTQYMFNQLYFNPAYAGLSSGPQLTAIHRSQWFGYDGTINPGGAPSTQMISLNNSFSGIKGVGYGLYISNDNLGPATNFEVKGAFSYQMNVQGGILSVGLSVGAYSSSLDFDELVLVDPSDVIAGLSGKESQIRPDLGIGIYYRKGNLFGGFSANHLLESTFDFGEDQISNQLSRHYYLIAGYDYQFNPKLTLTPSVFIKSVGFNTYNFDVSVIGKYDNKLWGGLSYRQSESVSVMAGYNLLSDRSLSLAYAVDLVVSDRPSKQPTSQEIMLIYNLSKSNRPTNPRRSIIRTPRYRY